MQAAIIESISCAEKVARKIRDRSARVGVVGLGYVGLPLAVEFAKVGFAVTGIDHQQAKVDKVNRAESYIRDVADADLHQVRKNKLLTAVSDFRAGAGLDTINI